MSKIAISNYMFLVKELLRDRKVRELSQDEEADRAEELHDWWEQMDTHEQIRVEQELLKLNQGTSLFRKLNGAIVGVVQDVAYWKATKDPLTLRTAFTLWLGVRWELFKMWLDRITGK